MTKKKRVLTAVLASLLGLTATSAFVSCGEKTTVIRQSVPAKEDSGIEFKVKTGDVDLEGKIPTEKK
jgi:hypothetical protein